jgi:hypothetical protein
VKGLTRRERVIDTIDWVLRIIGVGSLVFIMFLYVDVRNRGECQARINDAQSQRTLNLEDDTKAERATERKADDAMTVLVQGLLTGQPQAVTRVQFANLRVALEAQRQARITADKARTANPPIAVAPQHC